MSDKKTKAVKAPPQALAAEQAVLGAMLVEFPAARFAADFLAPTDFYVEHHRNAFSAAVAVLERDGAIDFATLSQELHRRGHLAGLTLPGSEAPQGRNYILHLLENTATTAHVSHYAKLVRHSSLERQVEAQLHKTAEDKTDENLVKLRDLLADLHGVHSRPIFDFRKDLGQVLDSLHAPAPDLVDTGWAAVDSHLGGLEPGDVTTIGARTSGGKTAAMVKMAVQMSKRGIPCLYLTTEMSSEQIVRRVLPAATGIPAWKFRKRKLDKTDLDKIHSAFADNLSSIPLMVSDKSQLSLGDIRSAAIRSKARIVFVDYLQRCTFPHGDTRAYQILDFMVALKTFARDIGINVVLGCQLDRKLDKTVGVLEPENADLKDSGAIEAESDQVLLLWKPSDKEIAKDPVPIPNGRTVIRCKGSKNRNGSAGWKVDLLLHGTLIDICEREAEAAARQQELLPPGGHYD